MASSNVIADLNSFICDVVITITRFAHIKIGALNLELVYLLATIT